MAPVTQGDEFLTGGIGHAPVCHGTALAHHPHSVGQLHDLVEAVADEQEGPALATEPQDQLLDLGALLH